MNQPRRPNTLTVSRSGVIWIGLLLLVVLAPIPFGANRPWAWSIMSLWTSFLLAGWTMLVGLGRKALVWRPALIFPLVLLGSVVVWILATILPGLGPANPVWELAAEQLGRPLPQRIALSVEGVLVSLMRLLSYASVFWLSLQYCRDSNRAETLLAWASWLGFVLALYGLINFFAGNPNLLWYERWTGQGDVTATFVNRNHYATFAGLGLICAIGMCVTAFRSVWRLSDRSQPTLAHSIECMAGRPLIYFMITLVIAMALLQTHSRMGAAATSLGVIVMLGLLMVAGLIRRGPVLAIVAVLTVFFLVQVSGSLMLERIGVTTSEVDRLPLFAIVSEQIASAPYTGSGYGSFSEAFLMYRDLRLPFHGTYLSAHNSYLEIAAEIGLPAAIALVSAIAWCALLCLVGVFRRRRDRLYPIIAVAATVVVAVHALLDFSIQVPAVALIYAALLGMGLAQSWSISD